METLRSQIAEWGVGSRPVGDSIGSGDDCLVRWHRSGGLVAVVDGLGHGRDASLAARSAIDVLDAHTTEPLERLFQRCHEAARETRGLTMAIAVINADQGSMAWFGVGNVQGLLVRARPGVFLPRETLLVRSGVVGQRIPPFAPVTVSIAPGDVLAMATDGIRSDFESTISTGETARAAATRVLERYALPTDDALVVVVRYLGRPQ
ncbi:MAG TPA: SpoIIE family protein phosphatase [Candidatus Eisenbacteria bacterium]|nr:SpoIIE family protein phosphatase [Candidatus Eisenbacteria bacterium]